jgi:hypothetical protein
VPVPRVVRLREGRRQQRRAEGLCLRHRIYRKFFKHAAAWDGGRRSGCSGNRARRIDAAAAAGLGAAIAVGIGVAATVAASGAQAETSRALGVRRRVIKHGSASERRNARRRRCGRRERHSAERESLPRGQEDALDAQQPARRGQPRVLQQRREGAGNFNGREHGRQD